MSRRPGPGRRHLGRVEVVIDAQRNEFYLAGYDLSAGGAA